MSSVFNNLDAPEGARQAVLYMKYMTPTDEIYDYFGRSLSDPLLCSAYDERRGRCMMDV